MGSVVVGDYPLTGRTRRRRLETRRFRPRLEASFALKFFSFDRIIIPGKELFYSFELLFGKLKENFFFLLPRSLVILVLTRVGGLRGRGQPPPVLFSR